MSLLGEPRFRRLLIGQACSNTGDTALALSLGIWVKDLTGSNAAAGATLVAINAPTVLLPLAGQLVDRLPRRQIVIYTNLLSSVVVLLLIMVNTAKEVWLIYAVAAWFGLAIYVISAAQAGLLKDLLPNDALPAANAISLAINRGLRLGAPLLGAGLYVAVGGPTLSVCISVILLASVGAFLTVDIHESSAAARTVAFWTELTAGFRHVKNTPLLRQVSVAVGGTTFFAGVADASRFAVVDEGLGRSASFIGVMLSVHAIGGLFGAAVSPRLLRKFGAARVIGTALTGYSIGVLVTAIGSVSVVLTGFCIQGFFIMWVFIAYPTALQQNSPPTLQGRANALANMVIFAPLSMTLAAGAALLTFVDYRVLLVIASLGSALSAAVPLIRPIRPGHEESHRVSAVAHT